MVNLFYCKFVLYHVVTGSAHDIFTAHLKVIFLPLLSFFILICSEY
jgi:hypothetical protein